MRRVGGLVAIALALASCAHGGRRSHAGRDATADGARRLEVDRRRAVTGVVTARGGDPVDWYTFEVDRTCRSVGVDIRVAPARPGLELAIKLVRPDGKTVSRRVGKKHSRRNAVQIENAARGHYFVGVKTVGESAATYRLLVQDATTGFECGDLPPPRPEMVLQAPASISPPAAGARGTPIAAWRVYREGRGLSYVAELPAGFDDGIRQTVGVLLDANGQVVPGAQLRVEAYDAHRSLGTLVGQVGAAPEAWSVALAGEPVPPPPLTANVIDRWKERGTIFVRLDRGSLDGVVVGWRGTYRGGGTLEVTQVGGIESVARLDATSLDSVLAVKAIRVAPAP